MNADEIVAKVTECLGQPRLLPADHVFRNWYWGTTETYLMVDAYQGGDGRVIFLLQGQGVLVKGYIAESLTDLPDLLLRGELGGLSKNFPLIPLAVAIECAARVLAKP